MKTINLIIPYFGPFPSYFQLFLHSCETNPTIDWTIITDNVDKHDYPLNVHIVNSTFSELVQKIQTKFDFNIQLKTPYKLCDYRPMYGFLFPEIIRDYDYWGYCDVDVIYGDLRKFLTDDVLIYDKVFELGHFSLIKNSKECNELFMKPIKEKLFYKSVLSSNKNFNFDETFKDRISINKLFSDNNYKIYGKSTAADIYTKSSRFLLDDMYQNHEKKSNSFFLWNKGKLWRYIKENSEIRKKEYMYIHLQKRKMSVRIEEESCFKIIPNAFEPLEVSIDKIEKSFSHIKKQNFNLHYFKIRYKNFLAKIKKVMGKIRK
ncbi:MAG: hypothetical protein PHS74_04180 [Lachnospiraceae bacterium]|nr:hypothetical protein [Lachnospiraceae bacterium]